MAILLTGMSREQSEWPPRIAGGVITTPGCESSAKEIFDETHELR